MRLRDILTEGCDSCTYEELFFDDDGELITEGAQKAFQRKNKKITRKFRCLTGPKKGKIVASAAACSQRKDPKRVRLGRASARKNKGTRVMKTRVAKRSSQSKLVTKLNRRLSHKST
jgi:hypothetical protein